MMVFLFIDNSWAEELEKLSSFQNEKSIKIYLLDNRQEKKKREGKK